MSTVTGSSGSIVTWQCRPWGTCPHNPKNAIENKAVVDVRSAFTAGCSLVARNKFVDDLPLLIREFNLHEKIKVKSNRYVNWHF
jgi:hypothetical protein